MTERESRGNRSAAWGIIAGLCGTGAFTAWQVGTSSKSHLPVLLVCVLGGLAAVTLYMCCGEVFGWRQTSVAYGVAAAGVVAIVWVMLPSRPSHHLAVPVALSYVFTPAARHDGLVIDRQWSASGSGDTVFTETLTVSNPTKSAIRASYAESVPPRLRADIGNARFTPAKPKISDSGAVLNWIMNVPAGGHGSYGFQVVLRSGVSSQSELDQWAAAVAGPGKSGKSGTSGGSSRLRSLSIAPGSPRLAVSGSLRLTLRGVLANGKPAPSAILATVSWHSSDTSVLTVAADGLLTAYAPGTARVTARAGTVTATVTVTVRQTTPTPTTGYTYQPPPTQQPSTPPTTPTPTHPSPTKSSPVATITPTSI